MNPAILEDDAQKTSSGPTSKSGNPRIFLMSNSLETGGSERQFAALAESVDRGRFEVSLGCIMRRGPFLAGLGEIAEFGLGGSLYGLQSVRTRLRLAGQLQASGVSIAQAFDFYTNLTLIPAARWAGVPVVIGSQRQLGDLLTWKQERAQATVLRWCDAVVCNSRAAAGRLAQLGVSEERIVVIGNGLAPESFAAGPPAVPRVPGMLRVGMIARMNTRAKNHWLFLRTAARLKARFANVQFVLVGDGPLRAELEKETEELGISRQVLFLGERSDVTAVLASLDISVLPSESESLSNAILESMAAGVPVVASRAGGNCELVEDDRGVLIAPNDEAALVEAVDCLLRDGALRAGLGQTAKRFVEDNFALTRMTGRYEALYEELLEKKRRGDSTSEPLRDAFSRSRRKRVAIVAASLSYVGGQSVQADLLLRHWKDDKDVEVSFIAVDPRFPGLLRWAERVPGLRTLIRQPIYLANLWRGLKRADVAHVFSASYWSFLLAPAPACAIARARAAKAIVHYHSGEARDHLRRFVGARDSLAAADRLVVPSGFLVDVFREFGLTAQAIPNIVELSDFRFRERRPLRPHLVCTRGFHPYYCVDVVVRAFAEVQKKYPNAKLDLAGGGPLEAEIRALVRDLRLTGVTFLGVVAHEKIADCYDAADIFINASQLDNMPVSILEAFAAGLPVVSTEPEGMKYVVEDGRTGLLSPVGDARRLAEGVLRLLRDAELAGSIALNARQEVERYSWQAVRQQWLDVYQDVYR